MLELGAFRAWRDRTGKYEADVYGYDPGPQHQQEGAAEGQGVGDGEATGGDGVAAAGGQDGDGDDVLVEFDPLADPELEGEI